MFNQKSPIKLIIALSFLIFSLALLNPAGALLLTTIASVMESENYKIQFDSINSGGERQTSENYIMEDTIGEMATGISSSESYNLYAGYQQMNETFLSISDGADINMSGLDMDNSTSTGSTSWTVITDNAAGYKLEVYANATSTNACARYYLCNSDTQEEFADYQEASGTTPEIWNTADGNYEFGFSAYGEDVTDVTWGSGSSCGSGTSLPQDLFYRGFNDENDSGPETIEIANRGSGTGAGGIVTNFCLGAVQSNVYAPSGVYTATTTARATAL